MRIVHIGNIYYGYGGTEETVRTIQRELIKLGHECYAITYNNSMQTVKRKDREDGVQVFNFDDKKDFSKIDEIANDETVAYTVLFNNKRVWEHLQQKGIPLVHEYNMPRQPLITNIRNRTFVFNSKWTKSWYPNLKGEVIYPLIDFSKYKVNNVDTECTIGMINPCIVKGVKVVKRIAITMKDRKFLLCGGWKHNSPGGCVHIPGLANVKHISNVDNASDFYNKMSILLVPTQDGDRFHGRHDESFGRVVLEGMHHGLPIIASYKDGIPEAIDESGVMVGNFTQHEHWVEAIQHVTDNMDYYRKKSEERVKRFQDNYKLDSLRWEKVFREALDGKSRTG